MPEVTWWQEGRMIDRHSEVRHSEQGVRNVLQLERLGRVDLGSSISCQASNTQLSQPLAKFVKIQLNREYINHWFIFHFGRIMSSRLLSAIATGFVRFDNSIILTQRKPVDAHHIYDIPMKWRAMIRSLKKTFQKQNGGRLATPLFWHEKASWCNYTILRWTEKAKTDPF